MPRGRATALFVGLSVAALATPLCPAAATEAVPIVVIDGAGWGHGVGMAQDGALAMGRQGAGLAQILGQFYPGTGMTQIRGDVRVPVLSAGSAPASVTITFPDGGQVVDTRTGQQSPGFPRPVPPGGTAVVTWNGQTYTVTTTPIPAGGVAAAAAAPMVVAATPTPTTAPCGLLGCVLTPPATTPTHPVTPVVGGTTTTRPPASHAPPTTMGHPPTSRTTAPATTEVTNPAPGPAPSSTPPLSSTRPIWALPTGGGALGVPGRGRSYRGDMEAEASTGALRLVNQVDVETYLTGMGEVLNPSWPLASLEAQEVAARTYAMRAMATAGEICDDTRCQVYLGTAGEYPAAEHAVAATAGDVLVYNGTLADTVFSANAAGFSASRQEGFGVTDAGYPYLRPAAYPEGPPLTWSSTVGAADAGAALGLAGPVSAVAVTAKGPSGRALQVTVTAGGIQTQVSGTAFAAALGLRSTMITVRMGNALAAPPRPTATPLQLLPEAAGTVAPVEVVATRSGRARVAVAAERRPAVGAGGLPTGPVGLAILLVALTGGAAAFETRRRGVSVRSSA